MLLVFRRPPQPQDAARQRLHDYTRHLLGQDYFFEQPLADSQNEPRFSITATGSGVRCNDYILLQGESAPVKYQVTQIDYYCNEAEMWTALLIPCST